MITIDYRPVLALDTESKIVFNDSAKSEPSYVYMDKTLAPKKRTLVWLQIQNPQYDPDDDLNDTLVPFPTIAEPGLQLPDHPVNPDPFGDGNYYDHAENPYFLFQKWMWLENIISNEFPANYKKDANGDPLVNPDGSLDLGDWNSHPGIVKLELYEHKFALSRQAALDNVNIIHRLTYVANKYNDLWPDRFLNDMDWSNLTTFLTVKKVKLDYDVDNSEYPPCLPQQCLWKHRTLEYCLDDLLRNFESRVLSTVEEFPDPDSYISNKEYLLDDTNKEVLTYLNWKYRKPIEYREDLLYEKILWPVRDEESHLDEDNSIIYFRTLSSLFGASPNLYAGGFYPPVPVSGAYNWNENYYFRSSLDFVCNLFPYASDYQASVFPLVQAYLNTAHVNMDTTYEFLTKSLPYDFYDTAEWSRISLVFTRDNYHYHVEHLPRSTWFPCENFSVAFNCMFKANVTDNFGSQLEVTDMVDITNNVTVPGTVTLQVSYPDAKSGDVITGVISGGDYYIINHYNLVPEDGPELIPIRFNGNEVTKITWTVDSWDPAIPTEDLRIYPDTDPRKVLNYAFESWINLDPGSNPFPTVEYDVTYHPTNGANVDPPSTDNLIAVTFVMAIPEEDRVQAVLDYLKSIPTAAAVGLDDDSPYLDGMAAYWVTYYERVTCYFGLSHTLQSCDLFTAETHLQRIKTRLGTHPDLDPVEFGVTDFPGTVDGIALPPFDPFFIPQVNFGIPINIAWVKDFLWERYHEYFQTFDRTVSLTYDT